MALDSNDGDFRRDSGREMPRDGGYPHREGRLVCVLDCIRNAELRARLSQSGSILCCGVYGDFKDRGRLDQLLGGENTM